MPAGPLEVLEAVSRVLERRGISYLIGGSIASSHYGVPRSTLDIDLVADLTAADALPLATDLAGDFYVDEVMILEAIEARRSFNVIHRQSMFKVDVFVMKDDEWSAVEMERARVESIEGTQGPVNVRFASAEDTLLHKLVWYKLGDESSDRQWGDVVGLMRVHGSRLDHQYLELWAPQLDVEDLLARARDERGAR